MITTDRSSLCHRKHRATFIRRSVYPSSTSFTKGYLIYVPIILTYISITVSLKPQAGVPVPGAEVLTDIFSKYLFTEGKLTNYIKGKTSNDTYADENLDISILDVNNVRKIINMAKLQYETNYRRSNKRPYYTNLRYNKIQTAGYKSHKRPNPYVKDAKRFDVWTDLVYKLMEQSIYATQYRIEDTKKYRSLFVDHPSYKIALLYGACTQYINKMDTYYTQSKRLPMRTHFLWHLILYEKLIALNVDINNAIDRIFQIQKVYTDLNKGRQGLPKGYLKDMLMYGNK